ncbi:MAG: insulinase family protein [Ilumatobacter sp.]|nr:insulinase family protein [Ilumatobacter sp.]
MARRAVTTLFTAALAIAACTASPGVSRTDSGTDPSSPGGTGSIAPTVGGTGGPTGSPSIGTRAPVEPPDPTGLPSLDDVDPAIVRGTLDNGLRYLIRENDNPGSRVEMRLTIDAGSGQQDDDQGGGAHFLEHMLFNGTEKFPENELVAVLRSFGAGFGADINATTSYDETVYELTMPTADATVVSTGLEVLHQWLTAATIDQRQVEAERGIVLDEWRLSADSADGRLGTAAQRFFLDGTPYEARTPIGERDEIVTTDAEPLRRFYDDWYRPDNAAVIVVGDIDADEIEQQVRELFSPSTSRGASPERADLVVGPSPDVQAMVADDPDLAEGYAFVTLPVDRDLSRSPEATFQRDLLGELAFDMIATRLSDDANRGTAPFDSARVDSSSLVRLLDAPEIFVTADGPDLEASTRAVLDEYERVRRFGFTDAEVERAVAARRRAAQTDLDGRFSRQDASFADEYVRHVLDDEPLPTAQRWFDYVDDVLDRASPSTIASVFIERLDASGPHLFVAAPSDDADDVPGPDVFAAQVAASTERDLERRPAETAIGDRLMDPPDPVDEVAATVLADGSQISFIAPRVLTFPNGVRVALNVTPIVEGTVLIEGRSPGGTSVIDDADVADALAADIVVERSGVAGLDRVALDAFLSDKAIGFDATLDVFAEGLVGFSSTADLETAMQLIHLGMTEPRVDPVALGQFIDDERPFAADPSIDPGYAQIKTLTEARYDDPRHHLLDVDDLDSLDAADVERVYRDRFGDASDWAFSLSGDFDLAEAASLARTYLGTLPATGRDEPTDWVEPAPPDGVVVETARAGQGDGASVAFLFTGPASASRRDDVAARMVQQVVTTRLSDTIREELGESYSPFGAVEVSGGATPVAELFVSISTGPDLVDSVSGAVRAQLDALRTDGPTAAEFVAARETVTNQLGLFSNEQINDEVLRVLTDPAGHASFGDFLTQVNVVDSITADDLRDDIARWAPADRFIEVRVLPR